MRKFMTSIFGAILVLAVITASADTTNFTDISFGISVDVDDALIKQPLLRDIQYFNSQDRSASLLIKRIHDLSVTEFLQELREVGYRNMRDGVTLAISGEPIEADIESGRGLLIPVNGRIRGQPIRGMVGAYSGHDGQGFLVIGNAKPGYWAAWSPRMMTMLKSVRFVEIDREAMVRAWEDWLKGKRLQYQQANLTRNPAAGGFGRGAGERDYHLCSDGTVMRQSGPAGQAGRMNPQMYGRGMNQSRGTWHVIVLKGTPYLIVRDDREQKLMLENSGNKFLLNGKPYIAAVNNLCN